MPASPTFFVAGMALPGYLSRVTMVPDLKLGVAVMSNQESVAHLSIMNHIIDYYLGYSDVDWFDTYKAYDQQRKVRIAAEEEKISTQRDSSSGPSRSQCIHWYLR
ncbi:MAG: hypothetical protein IIB44_09550 [Candidatus Marinimicrobia bacterium]|nr:hypothetical protein [Candidatus Neomarinimicrobiota bacterium]